MSITRASLWRLADHEEPELPLPVYDPFAPPVPEPLDENERALKHDAIKSLNERIRRWLKYRVRSLRNGLTSQAAMRDNPFSQFMHESYGTVIAPVVAERWKEQSINADGSANTKKPNAPFRCAVARELFAALPQEEQDEISARAKEEAKQAKLDYAQGMKEGPSKSPEARQRCIDGFGRFIAPIMKGLHDYTGLKGYILLGGPIPRYAGEIGTVHLSVGSNLASVPTPFPGWDKQRWNRDVVGYLKEYLATAFSAEECSEAALPSTEPLKAGLFTFDSDVPESDSDSDSSSSSSSSSSDDEEEESEESEEEDGGKKGKEKAKKRNEKKEKAKGKGKAKATAPTTGVKKRKRAVEEEAGGAAKKGKNTGGDDNSNREEDEAEAARRADKAARIEEGRRYAQERNANMARNDALLSASRLAIGIVPVGKKATGGEAGKESARCRRRRRASPQI
ncbi:hypothetical protein C8F04DRAFT_1260480 [Mycena alexandri]|uniref:Uncharacterized protein n=1 Tax=Mycena alexandri TaxID=1745969 RepID=A0AAD6X060_9AGAR|nr:hypothetical protein C8F04DRAFT_1260480 [Mycena alexandri]